MHLALLANPLLSVQQINTGFTRLNPEIEQNFTNQAVIVWSITLLATASVVSGVKVGIRRLSEINFLMGQFIMLIILFQENTWCALKALCSAVLTRVNVLLWSLHMPCSRTHGCHSLLQTVLCAWLAL